MSTNEFEKIPVYNIEVPITNDSLIIQLRGDQHIGHRSISINEMLAAELKNVKKHKDHIIILDTGDMIENNIKGSVSDPHETNIPDIDDQIKEALKYQEKIDNVLYANTDLSKKLKVKDMRRFGVLGNHELRSRKQTDTWLHTSLYTGNGVIGNKFHCLINITLVNKAKKLRRTHTVYLTHRLAKSGVVSQSTIINHFQRFKGDIPAAQIYVCGHYHQNFAMSDTRYDMQGSKQKLLYVINPSAVNSEYAAESMFGPINNNYFTNITLPINKKEQITTEV